MLDVLERADRRVTGLLSRWSMPALRMALGIVFIWFGALKVFRGGNLLLLTVERELIVKNLVLLAAGLVVGSTVRGSRSRVRVQTDGEES